LAKALKTIFKSDAKIWGYEKLLQSSNGLKKPKL
jgi:hypothetical protein